MRPEEFRGGPLLSATALDACRDGNPRARRDPLVVGLKVETELFVVDPQIAVAAANDRRRHDRLHLLRHDTDISPVAAVIGKAIEPKAVLEMADQGDVLFEPDIGTPTTAPAATSPHTAAGAHSSSASMAHARRPTGHGTMTRGGGPLTRGVAAVGRLMRGAVCLGRACCERAACLERAWPPCLGRAACF